jgi:hypothetical protein
MQGPQRILVVGESLVFNVPLLWWLAAERYDVLAVATFATAKAELERGPRLLITQVRLREYNGLHLALWGNARGIPSIVVGDPDPVLEREAKEIGGTLVTTLDRLRDRMSALLRSLPASRVSPISGRDGTAWIDASHQVTRSARLPIDADASASMGRKAVMLKH